MEENKYIIGPATTSAFVIKKIKDIMVPASLAAFAIEKKYGFRNNATKRERKDIIKVITNLENRGTS